MPFDRSHGAPQRIAIVGGGIAGLASAWTLAARHRVTLYETAPRFGGHARTVVAGRNGDQPTVDLLSARMMVHEQNAWMLRSLLEE